MLDLRFVIGGAPRAVEPNSLLVLDAQTLDDAAERAGRRRRPHPPVVRGRGPRLDGRTATSNHLFGTNPESGRVVRDEVVGTDPVAVAIGLRRRLGRQRRQRLDHPRAARRATKIETIGLDDQPSAITTGAGYVWVVSKRSGKVIRIDPKTKQVDKTLRLANPPLDGRRARRPRLARDRRLNRHGPGTGAGGPRPYDGRWS